MDYFMKSLLCLLALVIANCSLEAVVYTQPEQIHLSISNNDSNTFIVTWVTQTWINQSYVLFGLNSNLTQRVQSSDDNFNDSGSEKRVLYMHRATMQNLNPWSSYGYMVGSKFGWSNVYTFKTFPGGNDFQMRYVVIGDMGNLNARSLAALQQETWQGRYDMLLHVGDFAYNMDTDNARIGDEFMRQIQPIAAKIPYMTCPGNHEQAYNFSNYRRRFTMPGGDNEGQFFSFNVGLAHIIAYSSEFYYFYDSYGTKQIVNQYNWLENDLKEATKPENRKKHPWIIVMGHRPMYCSNSNDPEHCERVANLVRVGLLVEFKKGFGSIFICGLEELFYRYGVDLIFGAHEHSYERMWPVYNWKVMNGSLEEPYTNPGAPVHIVTGSAGNQEGEDPFYPHSPEYSAFHASDYGYTRMNIYNTTHLTLEQVSDDLNGKVIDQITYIKTSHGPYEKK